MKRIYDLNRLFLCDFKHIIYRFQWWHEIYNKGKYCCLQKISNKNMYCFVRQISRFQMIYKRKVWNKLEQLNNVSFSHHLTLEVNPHNHLNYYSEWLCMLNAWDKLRAWLVKKFGKNLYFLRIVEIHKSGRPHFHILIGGFKGFLNHAMINRFWGSRGKYGIGFSYVQVLDNSFKALYYLLKYIKKNVVNDVKYNAVSSAIFFATNKRVFSVSRNILNDIGFRSKEKEKQYDWLGSVDAGDINVYCDAKGLANNPLFLRVEFVQEDLYEHGRIFKVNYEVLGG